VVALRSAGSIVMTKTIFFVAADSTDYRIHGSYYARRWSELVSNVIYTLQCVAARLVRNTIEGEDRIVVTCHGTSDEEYLMRSPLHDFLG
jgi:hypothetical protein